MGERHATPCSSCSRRWTPPARTRRSSTSCPASTRRACRSSRSSSRRARSSTTRSCGGSPRPRPSGAGSGSSTGPTTRRSSPCGCTRSGSTSRALPAGDRGPAFWAGRYDDLNAFEQHLDRNGTKVVKFFLHVSKAEQKRRFMARLDNPDKQWKFNAGDVAERRHWDEYMQAYEEAITATSTAWAPWYVIPADHKHVMQAMAAAILVDTIELARPAVADRLRRGPGGQRQGSCGARSRGRLIVATDHGPLHRGAPTPLRRR